MDLDKIKVEKAFLERLTASFVLAHLTYHPDTKGKEYREGSKFCGECGQKL